MLEKTRARFRDAVEKIGGDGAAASLLGCTRAYVYMLKTGLRERPGGRVGFAIQREMGIPFEAWHPSATTGGEAA